MTTLGRFVRTTSLGLLTGVFGFSLPVLAQQTPPASGTQTPPAQMQPGPSMGDQMRRQGMERGRMGQGVGQQMQGQGMQGQGMQGQMPDMMSGTMGPGTSPQMMQVMMHGHVADLPSEHIEGRIAFLHAELQIKEPQMPAWTEFANVLRANAKRIGEAQKAQPLQGAVSATDRLDQQERWLSARLESVKALKPAYTKLYAALDDKQKKIADELVTPHMGIR